MSCGTGIWECTLPYHLTKLTRFFLYKLRGVTLWAALSFLIEKKNVKEPTEWGTAGGFSAPKKSLIQGREFQCISTEWLRKMIGWRGRSCQSGGSHQRAQITKVQFWLRGTPESNYVFPLKFTPAAQKPMKCLACLAMQISPQQCSSSGAFITTCNACHPSSPHMAITQTCARQQLRGVGICLWPWQTYGHLYDFAMFIGHCSLSQEIWLCVKNSIVFPPGYLSQGKFLCGDA